MRTSRLRDQEARRGAGGIAEGLLDRAGGEWPPDDRAQHDGTLEALAAAPPEEAVEERRSAGREMSLDDAVALALSDERR